MNVELEGFVHQVNPDILAANLIIQMNGFLCQDLVEKITGMSRTEIYRMRKAPIEPQHQKLLTGTPQFRFEYWGQ